MEPTLNFKHIKYLLFFSLFLSIMSVIFCLVPNSQYLTYSQIENNNGTHRHSWTSERDNLNITIELVPKVPIIDQKTKILFDIRTLNNSNVIEGLNAKVTLTDHDSRLYKFENKFIPINNGKFSIEYIFPDHGQHRILLQLYKNTIPFTVASFDIFIPHSSPQLAPGANKDLFSQLFESFYS